MNQLLPNLKSKNIVELVVYLLIFPIMFSK